MNSIHITDWAGLLEWSFCFFAICLFAWAFLRNAIVHALRGLGWMRGPANREEIAHAIKVKERLMDLSKKPNGSGEWGKARLFGAWIAGVLMTVAVTAVFTVKHDREIKRLQLENQQLKMELSVSPDTYTWFEVLRVYDAWDFQLQFINGGNPFDIHFDHDGSELKLGWDEGMIVESMTFRPTSTGNTVAAHNLGMRIHRNTATGKFIDYRSAAWITTMQSQR
ncbi:MAG TPA: hypothetical protein VN861_03380 [Candidatus Acidoferrales bacterium]|nr:hypothetical protein [Candidatus Acidoferrales bacterium]